MYFTGKYAFLCVLYMLELSITDGVIAVRSDGAAKVSKLVV